MPVIDFAELSVYQRYKRMASLIVPRPIALITTLGEDGTVNAAPFSMFNMLGEVPPIVMVSINRPQDGALKDTAANILRTGEFVVHLTDEAMCAQMDACAATSSERAGSRRPVRPAGTDDQAAAHRRGAGRL